MSKRFSKPSHLDCHYVVFDCESGGRNPYEVDIIELSAIVVDCSTLEPKDITFNQLIQIGRAHV